MSHEATAFICSSLIAVTLATTRLVAQQVADTLCRANVSSPAHKEGARPTVLIDEGYHNYHTMSGPHRTPAGMNDPTAPQNAQFLLNDIHWLSGLL